MNYLIYLFKNFENWHPLTQILFYAAVIILGCTGLAKLQGY